MSFVIEAVGPAPAGLLTGTPRLDAQGNLVFEVRAGQHGHARFAVTMHDDGASPGPTLETLVTGPPYVLPPRFAGQLTPPVSHEFSVCVAKVNQAPFFEAATPVIAPSGELERTSRLVFALGLSAGLGDDGQALSWTFSYTNPWLFSRAPVLTVEDAWPVGTERVRAGVAEVTINPQVYGHSDFTVYLVDDGPGDAARGDINVSRPRLIRLAISNPNYQPTFELAHTTLSLTEDAPEQHLPRFIRNARPGPPREAGQNLTFALHGVSALASAWPADQLFRSFRLAPALRCGDGATCADLSQDLSFNVAPDLTGSFEVAIQARDDGGVADGGIDSTVRVFRVDVASVNDAPAFQLLQGQVSVMQASPFTPAAHQVDLARVAQAPQDEREQRLTFRLAFLDDRCPASYFLSGPSMLANGSLSFVAAESTGWMCVVGLQLVDDGGTLRGGANQSLQLPVTLQVFRRNTPPRFALSQTTLTVLATDSADGPSASAVVIPGLVVNITSGVEGEAPQDLSFNVRVAAGGMLLLRFAPVVSVNGTLRFEPFAGEHGSATVLISASDSGGTALGGQDTSDVHALRIVVLPLPHITSITPRLGAPHGRQRITIHGSFLSRLSSPTATASSSAFSSGSSGQSSLQPGPIATGTFSPGTLPPPPPPSASTAVPHVPPGSESLASDDSVEAAGEYSKTDTAAQTEASDKAHDAHATGEPSKDDDGRRLSGVDDDQPRPHFAPLQPRSDDEAPGPKSHDADAKTNDYASVFAGQNAATAGEPPSARRGRRLFGEAANLDAGAMLAGVTSEADGGTRGTHTCSPTGDGRGPGTEEYLEYWHDALHPEPQATRVLLGGRECDNVTLVSANEVVCRTPPLPAGGNPVVSVEVHVDERELDSSLGRLITRSARPPVAAVSFTYVSLFYGADSAVVYGLDLPRPGPQPAHALSRAPLPLTGKVLALCEFAGRLYAGGSLEASETQHYSKYVTSWDGHAQHALGYGVDGVVRVLMSMGSDLLVAGTFTRAYQPLSAGGGALLTGGMALWNAAAGEWRRFGGGAVAASVSAIARNHSRLYVAGAFRQGFHAGCEGLCAADLALDLEPWQPTALAGWSPVGGGVAGGGVLAMLMVEGRGLVVGGSFQLVGGGGAGADVGTAARCPHLALWNGLAWQCLGDVTHAVRALAALGEHLYVGGDFVSAGGMPLQYFARYHVTTGLWEAAGAGVAVNGPVMALRALGPCLYLGGVFSSPSRFVTRYCVDRDEAFDAVTGDQVGPVTAMAAASAADEAAMLARAPQRLLCHLSSVWTERPQGPCHGFDPASWNV